MFFFGLTSHIIAIGILSIFSVLFFFQSEPQTDFEEVSSVLNIHTMVVDGNWVDYSANETAEVNQTLFFKAPIPPLIYTYGNPIILVINKDHAQQINHRGPPTYNT